MNSQIVNKLVNNTKYIKNYLDGKSLYYYLLSSLSFLGISKRKLYRTNTFKFNSCLNVKQEQETVDSFLNVDESYSSILNETYRGSAELVSEYWETSWALISLHCVQALHNLDARVVDKIVEINLGVGRRMTVSHKSVKDLSFLASHNEA